MESESSQVRSGNRMENEKLFNYNPIKHEPKTETKEAQSSIHPFEDSELETTIIKVENYTGSDNDDGDAVANLVKSELVEYKSQNASTNISTQIHSETVILKKIQKIEAETKKEVLSKVGISPNSDEDDDSNCDSDSDSIADPELDPFADIDCDPSFSRRPQKSTRNSNILEAQRELINTGADCGGHSLNPPPPAPKTVLPSLAHFKRKGMRRQTTDFKLKCQLCLETQSSEIKLTTYLKICVASIPDSDNRRLRFCIDCNKLFPRAHEYRLHALKVHEIEVAKPGRYPIKCQFCPRTFALQDSLVFHVASHYQSRDRTEEDGASNLRPYKCPKECPSTFTTLRGLRSHLQAHENERRFKCPLPSCEKAFNFNFNLNDHLRRAHSSQEKTFDSEGKHLDFVGQTFKCEELNCGKTFKCKNNLRQHIVCHSTERPFKCQHPGCDRMFPSKSRATKHLEVHTGARRLKNKTADRPFKCEQCNSNFFKNWQLNYHLKRVHLNVTNKGMPGRKL